MNIKADDIRGMFVTTYIRIFVFLSDIQKHKNSNTQTVLLSIAYL